MVLPLQAALVGSASSQAFCFAFWCLHHSNSWLSRSALLMNPYGKNRPNNMHRKQMPSSAQYSHGPLESNHFHLWCLVVMHASICLWVFYSWWIKKIQNKTKQTKKKCPKQGTGRQLYTVPATVCFMVYPKWHNVYVMPLSVNQTWLNTVHLLLLGFPSHNKCLVLSFTHVLGGILVDNYSWCLQKQHVCLRWKQSEVVGKPDLVNNLPRRSLIYKS